MKKVLAILGAFGITAMAATTVVACNPTGAIEYKKEFKDLSSITADGIWLTDNNIYTIEQIQKLLTSPTKREEGTNKPIIQEYIAAMVAFDFTDGNKEKAQKAVKEATIKVFKKNDIGRYVVINDETEIKQGIDYAIQIINAEGTVKSEKLPIKIVTPVSTKDNELNLDAVDLPDDESKDIKVKQILTTKEKFFNSIQSSLIGNGSLDEILKLIDKQITNDLIYALSTELSKTLKYLGIENVLDENGNFQTMQRIVEQNLLSVDGEPSEKENFLTQVWNVKQAVINETKATVSFNLKILNNLKVTFTV